MFKKSTDFKLIKDSHANVGILTIFQDDAGFA
jgi:hypothetical protein